MTRPDSTAGRDLPSWQVWAALLIIYFVWGSTYLGIRVVVETMPPFLAAGVRFVIAGALLALLLVVRRGPAVLRISRGQLASAAVVGLLLLCIGNGFVTLGEQTVPSGLAALVVGVVPLMVLLLRRAAGEHVPTVALAGVIVGLVGLGILVVPGSMDRSIDLVGAMLLVIASFSWSVGSFVSRRIGLPRDPLVSAVYQLLSGGLMLLAVAGATGEWRFDPSSFSTASVVSLGYLIAAGSVLAYTGYTWLLQHAPISRVATYAYVNPVVAVVLGSLILNEHITPTAAVGAVLIVVSVAFSIWAEGRAGTSPSPGVAEVAGSQGSEVTAEVRAPS